MTSPEKSTHSPDSGDEKPTILPSVTELPLEPGKEKLHFVPRSELPLGDSTSQDAITGYDASLMRDRATLSTEEEKRVIRKIDWRLIPLLSVMYMVKTIDATNVS